MEFRTLTKSRGPTKYNCTAIAADNETDNETDNEADNEVDNEADNEIPGDPLIDPGSSGNRRDEQAPGI
jgi:hypothetical protein